jgi:hypothetical protein
MQSDLQKYESRVPGIPARRRYELQALSQQLFMAFEMFYPLTLLCFTQAMILVLLRVSDHASHSYYNNARDFDDDGHRKFDWRDCVGQYALYNTVRLMHKFLIFLSAMNIVVYWLDSVERESGFCMRSLPPAMQTAKTLSCLGPSTIKSFSEPFL